MSLVSPTWLSLSGESNNLRSTYIDGFLDVSSSRGVLLRSDVSFGGNVVLSRSNFTGTVSPNSTAATSATWSNNGISWASSASSSNVGFDGLNFQAYNAFNNNTGEGSRWIAGGAQNVQYNTSGTYVGSTSTTIGNSVGAKLGEWLQIQSSVPVVMKDFKFGTNATPERSPKTFYIVGSNDNSTWSPILYGSFSTTFALGNTYSGTITIPSGSTSTTMAVSNGTTSVTLTYTTYGNSATAYSYFRMIGVANYAASSGYTLDMSEWNINFTSTGSTSMASLAPSTTAYGQLALTGGLSVSAVSSFTSNVGIGTTNPQQTFHVNGRARILGTGSPNPGYANYDTYALAIDTYNSGNSVGQEFDKAIGLWGAGCYIDYFDWAYNRRWRMGQGGDLIFYCVRSDGVGVRIANGATSWASSSDARLKKNIVSIGSSLDAILQLNPVTYEWISDEDDNTHIGFIAQEVELLLPQLVTESSHKNYDFKIKSVDITSMTPYIVKAMREQQVLIQSQQSQIDALVARLAAAGIA